MRDDEDDNGRWKNVLIELLFIKDFCSSLEEAQAIVESIEEEQEDNRDRDRDSPGMETESKAWSDALQDFLGISAEESQEVISISKGAVEKVDDDEDTHEDAEIESLPEKDEEADKKEEEM